VGQDSDPVIFKRQDRNPVPRKVEEIIVELPHWLNQIFTFLLAILPGGLWMAFWLFAVNWKRTWKFLADGAWAPLILLALMSAFVWSRIAPSTCNCLYFVTLPNFVWQLGSVAALICCALFSGWLQGVLHIQPFEAEFDPPAHAHSHDHHGHDHH